jgi:hypothetical protein
MRWTKGSRPGGGLPRPAGDASFSSFAQVSWLSPDSLGAYAPTAAATGWTVITSVSLAQAKHAVPPRRTAIGSQAPPFASLVIASWEGRADQLEQLIATAASRTATEGNGAWLSSAGWASAVLRNGLGRYEEAPAAAVDGSAYPDEVGMANSSLVELVEAAARAGVPERASGAMERIAEMADACRTDWIRGIEARSRALLTEAQGLTSSTAVRSNTWGYASAGLAGSHPAGLRRISAPEQPPGRRARGAARGPRRVRDERDVLVHGARQAGAGGGGASICMRARPRHATI